MAYPGMQQWAAFDEKCVTVPFQMKPKRPNPLFWVRLKDTAASKRLLQRRKAARNLGTKLRYTLSMTIRHTPSISALQGFNVRASLRLPGTNLTYNLCFDFPAVICISRHQFGIVSRNLNQSICLSPCLSVCLSEFRSPGTSPPLRRLCALLGDFDSWSAVIAMVIDELFILELSISLRRGYAK